MGDAENTLPPSKKRAAGRELSRDNPGLDDEEESSEQETGTFKKASDEVLANRRIVKVRRHQTSSTPSAPSSNPFAAIRLVPSTDSSSTAPEATKVENDKTASEDVNGKNNVKEETDETKDDNDKPIENKADEAGAESGVGDRKPDTEDDNDEPIENKADEAGAESGVGERKPDTVDEEGGKTGLADDKATEEDKVDDENNKDTEGTTAQNKDEKENDNETIEKGAEAASLSSFQQLSSTQNAFTGLTGTGFSSSTFSFGSIPKDGSPLGSGSGSLFGLKNDQTSYPSFGFGLPTNGNSSSFGTAGVSVGTKSEGTGFPPMQVVPVETGEENENAVFAADSVLFEFIEGGWKERGKGELKVNVSTTGLGKARLVMRARGNYRLILNASLYPDMKLTNMEKRGITFACMNSTGEGKGDLSTFALKFKDGSIVEEFRVAVEEHKGKSAAVLKTPENSP